MTNSLDYFYDLFFFFYFEIFFLFDIIIFNFYILFIFLNRIPIFSYVSLHQIYKLLNKTNKNYNNNNYKKL